VFGLLGPDPARSSYYGDGGERVRRIAAYGVRMVVEDFRKDVTKTKKDGTRGRLRIDYGDGQVASNPAAAIKWLWRFIVCRAAGCAEWFSGGARCRAAAPLKAKTAST
jgi:hypothetical protein